MKSALVVIVLSTAVCVLPSQAAPGGATRRWEQALFPALERRMCNPGAALVKAFKITPASCRRTFRYAARHCLKAAHQVPFYQVKNRSMGRVWGKWLGTCVGTAFDMKHTYRMRLP